jgi:hypothetical protein
MPIGPASYIGPVGNTGRSTGPHVHFELRDLARNVDIPLSQARTDIGQNIEYRLPGAAQWNKLYKPLAPGKFELSKNAPLTSPKGTRKHPVTGQQAYHFGEDYGLPAGTDLRFIGPAAVEGVANYGNAGNIARLTTGDKRYRLSAFHLAKPPGSTKVGDATVPEAPQLPASGQTNTEQRTKDVLEAFLRGTQYQLTEREKPKSPVDYMKQQLVGQVLSQAINPFSFLEDFKGGDPYMQGMTLANQDILSGYFS